MGSRFVLPLVVVVVLAAAAAVSWVLFGGAGSAPPDAAARSVAAPAEGGRPAAPARLTTPASGDDEAGPRRAAQAAEPAAAVADDRAATRPTSDLSLVGRVVDKLGNPIPGARVQLGRPFAFEIVGGQARPREAEVATTGADGRFELTEVEAGPQSLSARAAGFAPLAGRQVVVPRGQRHDVGSLVLSEGAILSGVVVDALGAPVEGAELLDAGDAGGFFTVDFPGRRPVLAETDAGGRFRIDELACGHWTLRVRHEEHPSKVFEGDADVPGAEVSGLELRLSLGAAIAGSVVGIPDDAGKVSVRARPVDPDGGFGFAGSRTATCDESGSFVVRGLEADTAYDLQARELTSARPGFLAFGGNARSDSVRARSGDRGVELRYDVGATIAFRVLDADTGDPITSLRVESGNEWPMPLRDDEGRVLSEFEDGRVEIGDVFPRNEGSRTTVRVTATGYYEWERDDLRTAPGQRLDLGEIRLEPAPVVVVNVFDDATGEPVEGAVVSLRPAPAPTEAGHVSMEMDISIGGDGDDDGVFVERGGSRRARTDENGVATLSSLEGKDTVLRVESDGHAPFELRGLFLPTGERVERDVRLRVGGTAVVTVTGPDGEPMAGVKVEHREPGADPNRRVFSSLRANDDLTDAEGVVVFTHLAAGVHAFRIADSRGPGAFFESGGDAMVMIEGAGMSERGEPWTEAEVVEGGRREVFLRGRARGRVEGRVRELGVPLAGATLRLQERADADDPMGGLRGAFGGGRSTRTDGDGQYAFHDVGPGEYTLEITHPSRAMPASRDLDVEERGGRVDERFDVDLSVAVVEGRIVDQDGAGLADVDVWAERVAGGGARVMRSFVMVGAGGGEETVSFGGGRADRLRTDAKGYYRLRGVPTDVDLVVKASSPYLQERESEPVRVAPDEVEGGVDLTLEHAGRIEVSIVDASGSPQGMCLLVATSRDDPELDPEREFVGPSGVATLSGLRPGAWSVSVQGLGGGPVATPDPEAGTPVRVVAGETAKLTLPGP